MHPIVFLSMCNTETVMFRCFLFLGIMHFCLEFQGFLFDGVIRPVAPRSQVKIACFFQLFSIHQSNVNVNVSVWRMAFANGSQLFVVVLVLHYCRVHVLQIQCQESALHAQFTQIELFVCVCLKFVMLVCHFSTERFSVMPNLLIKKKLFAHNYVRVAWKSFR